MFLLLCSDCQVLPTLLAALISTHDCVNSIEELARGGDHLMRCHILFRTIGVGPAVAGVMVIWYSSDFILLTPMQYQVTSEVVSRHTIPPDHSIL